MEDFKLYPAHIRFLQAPSKTKVQHLINYILKDMVLKRIFTAKTNTNYPTDRSKKPQKYTMLANGPMFENYDPQNFEAHFINGFNEINQIQIKPLINYVLGKYSLPSKFIDKEIEKPLSKASYVRSIPFFKAFGATKATSLGKDVVHKHNEKLGELEKNIFEAMDKNVSLTPLITEAGTDLFFIEENNAVLFNEVASKALEELKSGNKDLIPFFEASMVDLSYFHE